MMFSRSLMSGMKTCMNRSNQGVLQHVRTRTTLPSAFQPFYKTVFKNNFTYVTYIVVGAIAFEIVYGKFGDFVWETSNQGRLFHHIDWSKFKMDDDDEEEEEEEEAAEEEEEVAEVEEEAVDEEATSDDEDEE